VKSPTLQIGKTIDAPWSEATRQKLITFWATKRFRFLVQVNESLSATRGNFLWNLFAYDMSRVRADLNIRPSHSGRISLALTIYTAFQKVSEWNWAFWELEMATCKSFLLRGDLRELEWIQFRKGHRKAGLIWTFTLGIGGRRMPQSPAPITEAVCAECRDVFDVESMIAHNGLHVCARCKPIFLQRLVEGAKISSASELLK